MPRISFVIPIYKTELYLKRCLDSLLEQDYEDYKIICVLDGDNKKCKDILDSYVNHPLQNKMHELKIKHGGACAARNAGAKIAKGDYISFFSSDFIMFPGGLRRWIEELKSNPNFIYSEYRFMKDGNITNQSCQTEDFDARQLEVYNYIDGGFPVKRKLWEKYPWDTNCKSLNDWLFWLKIVKLGGYKGKRIKDVIYAAEVPRPKGLSYDSNDNWLERVKYVKEQVGIKHRDICLVSLGAKYHAQKMAKIVDADFNLNTLFKETDYKLFYLMGFYCADLDMLTSHLNLVLMMKKRGSKIGIHWIGGDTYQLMNRPFIDVQKIVIKLNEVVDYHLCENKRCAKELANMGIIAKVVPVPISKELPLMPLPRHFRVAMYTPGRAKDPKDKNLPITSYAIADKLPKIKFNFYGDDIIKGKDNFHPNITHCGMVDFENFGKKNSLIIRLCKHDSVPMAAVDFITMGRRVITNIENFPYMTYINSKEIAADKFMDIICAEIKRIKKLKTNPQAKEARAYYLKLHSQKKYIKSIKGLLNGR